MGSFDICRDFFLNEKWQESHLGERTPEVCHTDCSILVALSSGSWCCFQRFFRTSWRHGQHDICVV
jgi:hypothetical protein